MKLFYTCKKAPLASLFLMRPIARSISERDSIKEARYFAVLMVILVCFCFGASLCKLNGLGIARKVSCYQH